MQTKKVTAASLGLGVITERLDYEINRVLENIVDPNTRAVVVREVNLKIKFKPQADEREIVNYEIVSTSKLAPVIEHSGMAYIGKDAQGTSLHEKDPDNVNLVSEEKKELV